MKQAKHILVVDDHDDTRDLVTAAFTRRGHRVSTASNGREALDLLIHDVHDTPDVVILDIDMPVMSGDEFLEIKQVYARLAVIPVIVLTATHQELRHPVVVAHFKKPIDPDVLVRAVEAEP